MSGISSAELMLLLVLGLIVLGPKRLPEIASKIGGWIGQARRMTRVMKRQLEEELQVDNLNTLQPRVPPTTVDEHIPNDDDNYSPAHEEDEGR